MTVRAVVGSVAQDFGKRWEVVDPNLERVSVHTTIKAAVRVAGKSPLMDSLWLDVEIYADLELLLTELEEEEETELPPIIQDEVPDWKTWIEAA